MGGFSSKRRTSEVDLWEDDIHTVPNRKKSTAEYEWAEDSRTSYNLLDLQSGYDPYQHNYVKQSESRTRSPSPEARSIQSSSPVPQRTSTTRFRDVTNVSTHDDSACPKDYVPNQSKPNITRNYYTEPKVKKSPKKKLKPLAHRPPWQDIVPPKSANDDLSLSPPKGNNRKLSNVSDVSTVALSDVGDNRRSRSPPTFVTPKSVRPINGPAGSTQPRASSANLDMPIRSSKTNRRPYHQQASVRPGPVVKSHSDPALRKASLSSSVKSNETRRKRRVSKSDSTPRSKSNSMSRPNVNNNNNESLENNNFKASLGLENSSERKTFPYLKAKSVPTTIIHETRKDPAQVGRSRPQQTKSDLPAEKIKRPPPPPKINKVTKTSSQDSGRGSSNVGRQKDFTSIGSVKSATGSIASNASNFNMRSKVIQFPDRKQTLGSIGAAQITRLDNQFKVRSFPNGTQEGFTRANQLLNSGTWEKEIEGLELYAALADQDPQLMSQEIGKVRKNLLAQIKNLRSQVTRAACQCSAAIFLHLGRIMETELEKIVKELLQKSADTNKFIQRDANLSLDIMAENVSVNKALISILTLSNENKNAVLRANAAKMVDSVITRLGAERFMGSSEELQEIVVTLGSKHLTDPSLDVRLSGKHYWAELAQHSNTSKLINKYLSTSEIKAISKILENLR